MFFKRIKPETMLDNLEQELETDIEIDQYQFDHPINLNQYQLRPPRYDRPFFPFFPFFPHRRRRYPIY